MEMLPKFYCDDYDSSYVMHCKTQEESNVFTTHLAKLGMRWASGDSYEGDSRWSPRDGGTRYRFHAGVRGQLNTYNSDLSIFPVVVLEFSNFNWEDGELPATPVISYDDIMAC